MARLQPRYRKKSGKKVLSGYAGVFYDPDRYPHEKYVTLRTKDKRVARNKLVELEGAYSRGEFDPWEDSAPQEGVLLSEAIEQYLKARSNRRPKTLRADRSTLGLFAESLPAGYMLAHIEQRHVAGLLDRDDVSNATLHTYHTRIRAFFRWCVDEGMIRQDPTRKVEKPRLQRKEKEYLTRDQYERLIRCIEADAVMQSDTLKNGEVTWLVDVVRVAVGTGMRLGELCNLRWNAINLAEGLLTVKNSHTFKTKSGHERMIPVDGEARAALEQLNNRRTSEADDYVFKPLSTRRSTKEKLNGEYVSKRFLHYARMAKLPDGIHFHSLRHTYITWMIEQGIPVPLVQKLAGHADITTTMQYAHHAPDSLRDAVRRVFGGNEPLERAMNLDGPK